MKVPFKIYAFLFCCGLSGYSQQDSIPATKLDEIVVTGQYNPQSVRKSVFQVKIISRADIDRQAGNNLADLLNQTLNINIIPNASTGKSGVQLFGLGSEYFKILVDNIPVINDEGLGNNTDLTQINLDDIEQIEIVEGSMGVEYGANAVSGIINIITKKSSKYKWEIIPYIQEETVGDEYNLFDQGRHIQSLRVGHNLNSKFYANAMVTSNDFKGFRNDRQGKHHLENDGLRGYEWLPKKQLTIKPLLSYTLLNHRIFYKFEYFNEDTERFSADVLPNYSPATETTDPTASDAIFSSTRYYHHLNGAGKFALMNYDVSLSYQQQKRDVEKYSYRIRAGEKFNIEKSEYESREGIYSKGNFSNFVKSTTIDFQLGYEVSDIEGFSSAVAGILDRSNNVKRRLGSYDLFGSAEINIGSRFSVRPGARVLFSSQFDTQAAASLSSKYVFGNGYEFRTVVGTAPKLPNYDELYSYFVDVNHDVRGNADLNAEQGLSASVYLNKTFASANGLQFKNTLSAWYIDVKDRIELIIVSQSPLSYKYENIDIYKTWGTSFTSSMAYDNISANAGVTFSGASKVLDSQENYNDDYLYGIQFNANMSYTIPKWKTVLSAYAKYNGPQYQFVQKQNELNETVLVRGKQSDFSWLDATIRKSLLTDKLEITAGVRNILDITTVNTTATEGGSHIGPATALLLGYGRSYFLKILYRFNF